MAEMQFGQQFSEVNVNKGYQGKAREAQADRSHFEDYGALVNSVAKTATGMIDTKNASDANQARTDYVTMIMSEEYRSLSPTNRAELLEARYSSNSNDKSKAYTDAFINYSSGQYIIESDKRQIDINNTKYNVASAAQVAYLEEPTEYEVEVDGKIETRVGTNREAGKQPQDFVKYYSDSNNLDPSVVRTSLVKDLYGEAMFNIATADNTTEALNAAIENNKELMAPYQNDYFLTTKSKQGMAGLAPLNTQLNGAIAAKQKAIKAEALTRVELNKDLNNPDIAKTYLNMPNAEDYSEAYGDKAPQKYHDDMQKAKVIEEARQKSYVYDPDVTLDWSNESKETKELYQRDLDYRVQSQIENGNMEEASNTIISNGSVDSKRLDNIRQTIKSGLNSTDASQVYGQMMRMSAENGASLNVLFPDSRERSKILALGPMNQLRNESIEDTWNYIQSKPGIMPDKSKTRAEIKELSALIVDSDMPTELKGEIQGMYNIMESYGMEHGDIMDSIKQYTDTKPYEVNLSSYSSDSQKVMEYALNDFKFNPDNALFENPLNGYIFEQDIYGNKVKLIDKKGLYDYSNRMSMVKRYNREHRIQQATEKVFSKIAESVTDIVSNEAESLGNYKDALVNAGSYVNYLFMTKVTTDGKIVDRPEWEAPNSFKAQEVVRDGRDPIDTPSAKATRQVINKQDTNMPEEIYLDI